MNNFFCEALLVLHRLSQPAIPKKNSHVKSVFFFTGGVAAVESADVEECMHVYGLLFATPVYLLCPVLIGVCYNLVKLLHCTEVQAADMQRCTCTWHMCKTSHVSQPAECFILLVRLSSPLFASLSRYLPPQDSQ